MYILMYTCKQVPATVNLQASSVLKGNQMLTIICLALKQYSQQCTELGNEQSFIVLLLVYAARRGTEAVQTDAKTRQENSGPESATTVTEFYSTRL